MANSLEWYVIYMAILKTGAVVSPLNYRFASADIKYAANVAKCKVLIVDENLVSRVEPIREQLGYVKEFICVGGEAPSGMKLYSRIIEEGDPADVLVETKDDDMAELMFTSGTTGAPKPVCHTNSSLFHIAVGNGITCGEGFESVYIAPHPLYHSGSLFYSFPSYIAAGKVLLPMELQPKSMIESLASEKATGGWISVPIWSDIINAIKSGEVQIAKYDLSSLKYIAMGAQPVPSIIIEEGKKLFPRLKMMNTYGITEGGGGCTVALYDDDMKRKIGAIGQPGPFMDVKIVDNAGKECIIGQVGELLLKGPRLMKEYAFNPEQTAKTITEGWLHTGDLAYYDEAAFSIFRQGQGPDHTRRREHIPRRDRGRPAQASEDTGRSRYRLSPSAARRDQHGDYPAEGGRSHRGPGDRRFLQGKGLAKYKWPEKFVYTEIPRNPAGKMREDEAEGQIHERRWLIA